MEGIVMGSTMERTTPRKKAGDTEEPVENKRSSIPERTTPKSINLNDRPETAELKKGFDPGKELKKCWIDPNAKIEEPPTILEIEGIPTLTEGNISTVLGKAKSRKTFFMVGMLSAISNGSWGPMTGMCSDITVLWFDTEQSMHHASRMVKRCYKLGAGEIKAYSTRGYSPVERVQIIEHAIRNTPNLGFVAIDGIRDLLTRGINDEEEATEIISKFYKWTTEFDIHICVVIHTNKNDEKARGHIGTELVNKSETVFTVSKIENDPRITKVSGNDSRDVDFEPFAFMIEDNLPVETDIPEVSAKGKKKFSIHDIGEVKLVEVLDSVFLKGERFGYEDMWRTIKMVHGKKIGFISDNNAKNLLTYYKNEKFVKQDDDTKYYMT